MRKKGFNVGKHRSFDARLMLVPATLAAALSTPKTIALNNGVAMPRVIYGAGGSGTQDNVTGTTLALKLALSSDVGFAGLDTANTQKALSLTMTELRRLRDKVPIAGELRRARDYLIGQLELSLESTENQMNWVAEQLLGFAANTTLEDGMAAFCGWFLSDEARAVRQGPPSG